MDARYADIWRHYRDGAVSVFFDEQIAQLAVALKVDKTACYQLLQQNYDGYHFEHDTQECITRSACSTHWILQAIKNYWHGMAP